MKYFGGVVAVTAAMLLVILIALTYAGVVAPWSGRFYSLWDTGYAKIHIPIIASVSEHQPTTWFSFFFDLHILVTTFPVGLWYCIKHINDERVFGKKYENIFSLNTYIFYKLNTYICFISFLSQNILRLVVSYKY